MPLQQAERWDEAEMSPAEHLRELRTRLLRAVIALAICTLILIWPAPFMIHALVGLYFPGQVLHAFGPTDVISAEIRFAFYGGIVLSLPIIVSQIWLFIVPALTPRTRKLMYAFTLPSIALAGSGIAFCHFFILPRVAGALLLLTGEVAQATFGIAPTINLILSLFLAFALIFQTPLVIMALARIGLVHSSLLRRYRRHMMMAMLIIGGIAAPDGSPLTMLLLAAPLYILYEISILMITPLERAWKTTPPTNHPPGSQQ